MLKVGKDLVKNKKGKYKIATYKSVYFDEDGWANAKKYLPHDFDLVYLKTKNSTYSGWAIGNCWDGLKIDKNKEVLYWKRQDVL